MKIFLIIILLFTFGDIQGQEYYTRTGHVHVKLKNKLKNIEADSYQITSILNLEDGKIVFEGLIRLFEFRLGALDRAVTNRNLNVSQYPKIKFNGKIRNIKRYDFTKKGSFSVTVDGTLYIWDEKRKTTAQGNIIVDANGNIETCSDFVMTIEQQSVNKLNDLMRKKLPDALNINTQTLGIDRDILIHADLIYKLKTW